MGQRRAGSTRRPRSPTARRRRIPLSCARAPTGSCPVVLNQPPLAAPRTARPVARCSCDGPREPVRIAAGLKQLEQAEDQKRVVLGVAVDRGVRRCDTGAAASRARDPTASRAGTTRRAQPTPDDARPDRPPSTAERRATGQHARRSRERGDHQPVPAGQHLVVEMRTRPRRARLEQRRRARASARRRRPPAPAPQLARDRPRCPRAV